MRISTAKLIPKQSIVDVAANGSNEPKLLSAATCIEAKLPNNDRDVAVALLAATCF